MNKAANQYVNTGRGLSLLSQSLTGYDWSLSHDLNHDTLKRYATVGRELRAKAFRQALRRLSQATVGAVGQAAQAFKHQHLRRTNIRQLAELSDHQLKDIGLLRAEIPAAVDKLLRSELQPATEPKSKVLTITETKQPANDERSELAA